MRHLQEGVRPKTRVLPPPEEAIGSAIDAQQCKDSRAGQCWDRRSACPSRTSLQPERLKQKHKWQRAKEGQRRLEEWMTETDETI